MPPASTLPMCRLSPPEEVAPPRSDVTIPTGGCLLARSKPFSSTALSSDRHQAHQQDGDGPVSEPMVQNWLQYTHLDKLYGYLPGMPQAAPAIFGLGPAAYAEIIAQFDRRAAGAADRLLDDQRVAGWVDTLPFTPGQKLLAVGDSTTDDLQSWAVIFRHLLSKRRGQDHIDIINAGLSAHTTAMMLRRWPATLAVKPDWIMCALGTNDVPGWAWNRPNRPSLPTSR